MSGSSGMRRSSMRSAGDGNSHLRCRHALLVHSEDNQPACLPDKVLPLLPLHPHPMIPRFALLALVLSSIAAVASAATQPLKVMLLTGQSNRFHDWTKSSPLLKTYLEQTGLFAVDVVTAPAKDVEKSDFNPT